ncbi:MAG: hypothetical protein DMG58_09000 [Acidobacteria bacterium]|nr:MAG: hypothetical protein DMG58_09000 [Acidobacteriota bacterium]
MPQQQMRKVTVMLPKDLVERATKATGVGLTPTIRKGLESVVVAGAYQRIRERRGKVHLMINVDELREDRD